MNQYVATFHTHVAAMLTHRALSQAGVPARMAPVPRKLSSSCGTCVFFEAEGPCCEQMDHDVDHVYQSEMQGNYRELC